MLPQKKLSDDARGGEIVGYRPNALAMPMMPAVPAAAQGGLPVEGLGRTFWRRRWSILALLVLSLAGAFMYLDRAPKIFTSMARIYLQPRVSAVAPIGGITIGGQDPTVLFTQVEIIRSTPVLAEAAQTLGLSEGKSDTEIQHLTDGLRADLNIEVGRKDNIINVSFDSRDRQQAARVVNAIVEAYKAHSVRTAKGSANEVLDILKKKEAQQQAIRKNQFQALLDFKTENPEFMIVNSGGTGGGIMTTEIQKLRDQLTTQRLALIDAESNYEATRGAANNPTKLRQMAGAAIVGQLDPEGIELRKQLNDVELRLTVLLQRYPKGSPVLANDEALEKELQSRIAADDAKFAEAYTGGLYQEMLKAQQKEQEFEKLLAGEMADFGKINGKGAQFEKLTGELQQTDKLLTDLGEQIKKLDLGGDSTAPEVQIIEQGKPEDFPSKPAKVRIMGMALAAGLFLGMRPGPDPRTDGSAHPLN